MTWRRRGLIMLGLAAGLILVLGLWYSTREDEFAPSSPLRPASEDPLGLPLSPLTMPTESALGSPLTAPPTSPPPVSMATLEAMRISRATATAPAPSGVRLPYISPETWRRWALRILAAAGLLAYISLRLRQSQ